MSTRRPLFLSASINGSGWAGPSWQAAGTRWDRWADPEHYFEAARIAHRGRLDAVFLSDHPALPPDGSRSPHHVFDPIVLFSAIAGAVPDIGFVLTASTTYNSPYNLARRLASLDTISRGRLIWNAVSTFSPLVAANFGDEPVAPRDERYRRAGEFLQLVKDLWLSWDGPVEDLADRGLLWDATTARPVEHHGEFYDTSGPLNVPIGPQGHPVVAHAGASEQGLDFAARHAEIIYAPVPGKQVAANRIASLRDRAEAHGRDRDALRLLPGLSVVLGDTTEEALRTHEANHGLASEEELLDHFVHRSGLGTKPEIPAGTSPDEPLRPEWFPILTTDGTFQTVGHSKAIPEPLETEELTLRQLARRVEGGHALMVGTPQDVAQEIIEWWEAGGVDGFNVQFPVTNRDLERFVDEVVPILQAEGVFPRAYDGGTIRDRLGLPVPAPGTIA